MTLKIDFAVGFFFFILLNVFLYLFIIFFHNTLAFNRFNYLNNAHHFTRDPRVEGGSFNLISALAQFDAQWYLKIASTGYPKAVHIDLLQDRVMGSLTYAFFPLYPAVLAIFNYLFRNIELTAFVIANIILVINFVSLFYVVSKLYSEKIALKTIFLVFLFPFGIFFRSYFTEGLFLLLLIWFSYFMVRKRINLAGMFLGLLLVTRPNGFFLIFAFLGLVFAAFFKKQVKWVGIWQAILLFLAPFAIWLYLNFLQTGKFFYFYSVQASWFSGNNIFSPLVLNLSRLSGFVSLPLHSFHASKIDMLVALLGITLLIISRKKLLFELWLISFFLAAFPLIFKDTMSFSRYISVVFGLFIYLAIVLRGISYKFVLGFFLVSLFVVSLYFVNWYWIG